MGVQLEGDEVRVGIGSKALSPNREAAVGC